jgi:flavin reductase (DIM6/NTAB) family NADH-FMN oxidoreductase RutF
MAELKDVMRRWTTGVAIVTAQFQGFKHGMTVSSLTSISAFPPIITVALANKTRTYKLVSEAMKFAVTILTHEQTEISDLFAGKIPEEGDRFNGLETHTIPGDIPVLTNGMAVMGANVIHKFEMADSTLFIGEVYYCELDSERQPLIYYNRGYHRME